MQTEGENRRELGMRIGPSKIDLVFIYYLGSYRHYKCIQF